MADLKEKSQSLLSSTAMSMATNASKQTLYTVPTGKNCVVTRVVVRSPSATCAAATSIGLGFTVTSGTAGDWKASLSLLYLVTATTGYIIWDLTQAAAPTQVILGTTGQIFGIWIATGATATATVDVFGYLF